jgi:hypothetical protein
VDPGVTGSSCSRSWAEHGEASFPPAEMSADMYPSPPCTPLRVAVTVVPCADSSAVCARRQVTTDPVPGHIPHQPPALVIIDLTQPQAFARPASLEEERLQRQLRGQGQPAGQTWSATAVVHLSIGKEGAQWRRSYSSGRHPIGPGLVYGERSKKEDAMENTATGLDLSVEDVTPVTWDDLTEGWLRLEDSVGPQDSPDGVVQSGDGGCDCSSINSTAHIK